MLGLVLGPTLEREFRTALIMSEGSFGIFFSSVPALIFFVLTVAVIVPFIGQCARARAGSASKSSKRSREHA